MKFGLSGSTYSSIVNVLSSTGNVEEAIVYGSRAKGNYKPGSDIDITLKGKELNLTALAKIMSQLDDLSLPYTIDLSVFSHISNHDLIDHINRVGQVFYSRNQ